MAKNDNLIVIVVIGVVLLLLFNQGKISLFSILPELDNRVNYFDTSTDSSAFVPRAGSFHTGTSNPDVYENNLFIAVVGSGISGVSSLITTQAQDDGVQTLNFAGN